MRGIPGLENSAKSAEKPRTSVNAKRVAINQTKAYKSQHVNRIEFVTFLRHFGNHLKIKFRYSELANRTTAATTTRKSANRRKFLEFQQIFSENFDKQEVFRPNGSEEAISKKT